MQTRRPLSIESVLLTQGETSHKKLYLALANYFDKRYLKLKQVIAAKTSHREVLRAHSRDVKRKLGHSERKNLRYSQHKTDLKDLVVLNEKELQRVKAVNLNAAGGADQECFVEMWK